MEDKKVLLRITGLKQYFPLKKSSLFQKEQLYVKANDGITLDIYQGETFGLVGESGCGKSTFGRVILQLYRQTAGKTLYYGQTLLEAAPHYVGETLQNFSKLRQEVQGLREKQKLEQESEARTRLSQEIEARFRDLASIAGGFYALPNPAPALELLNKQFQAAVELKRLRINDKNLSRRQESLMREYQTQLDAIRSEYAGDPLFDRCEAFRDSGVDLARLRYEEMRLLRKDLQLIFQDPYSSLNPRMTVGQIIGEGLLAHGVYEKNGPELQEYVRQVMEDCGLAPYMLHRYPHQFSGGQRQRIGIARSLALRPKFIVCDEAVSALDVSIQSQILNLLRKLKERDNLTYLFISHDLSVVKYISDRIGVMYLGSLVELAPSAQLFTAPHHPYTEALLSAIPTTERRKRPPILLEGDIPSPIRPPKGCKFHPRCPYATDVCGEVEPVFAELAPGHFSACHHPLDHPVL